jgi:hypothetical protein
MNLTQFGRIGREPTLSIGILLLFNFLGVTDDHLTRLHHEHSQTGVPYEDGGCDEASRAGRASLASQPMRQEHGASNFPIYYDRQETLNRSLNGHGYHSTPRHSGDSATTRLLLDNHHFSATTVSIIHFANSHRRQTRIPICQPF